MFISVEYNFWGNYSFLNFSSRLLSQRCVWHKITSEPPDTWRPRQKDSFRKTISGSINTKAHNVILICQQYTVFWLPAGWSASCCRFLLSMPVWRNTALFPRPLIKECTALRRALSLTGGRMYLFSTVCKYHQIGNM